jgi:hypothetical protein
MALLGYFNLAPEITRLPKKTIIRYVSTLFILIHLPACALAESAELSTGASAAILLSYAQVIVSAYP